MPYRAEPPTALRIVVLDSLTAIYHRASGQTHVVAEPVPALLAALHSVQEEQALASLPDILRCLDLSDTADTRALLTERLDELVATGLVTRK